MATRALHATKRSSAKQTVSHANAFEDGGSPLPQEGDAQHEEIILDVDLDGVRYLLVRLPKADRSRVQLSPREQEIVRMVALGHSNKVMAEVLSISSWTICTHLRRIFAKLGVGSRAAMVARWLETGGGMAQKTPCPPPMARPSTVSRNSQANISQSSGKLRFDVRSELAAQRVRQDSISQPSLLDHAK